ncbi:MAG: MopE-related protein [Polyangiales bacterium]
MRTFSLSTGTLLALAVAAAGCSDNSMPQGDATPMMDAVAADRATPPTDSAVDTSVVTRCTSAAECDDGIACTEDGCGMDGVCTHAAMNDRCNDGRFCNGVESCNATTGCAAGTAPTCDDMNANTTDRCDEGANACRNDPLDNDGDGDPAMSAGGNDCDDNDRTRSSLEREVCNGRDDNCNGMIDEGALNSCGNCDPNCRGVSTGGMGGMAFDPGGQRGVELDPMAGGLLVRAQSRTGDYLWIPNTAESTISKWDAAAVPPVELARYRTGIVAGECAGRCCWDNNCNMPSRVAVDGFGDAYVANRGFTMQGTVTKVAADRRDCIDRNGNGMIETSSGRTNVLAYGAQASPADECVLWHANVGAPDAVLRALTVDRGDAMYPQGYVWVGAYNARTFWKLNPVTGAVLATVPVPVAPYGAVVTADGKLWIGTLDAGATAFIDTTRTPPTVSAAIPYPIAMRASSCRNSYGVTADSAGRIWFAGWDCRDALGYNPSTGQWTRVDTLPLVTGTAGRGITAGTDGYVYMAAGMSGESNSRVVRWLANDFAGGTNIASARVSVVFGGGGNAYVGPSGLGFDRLNNLWLAHHAGSSELIRINPMTSASAVFTGANRVYTYSDFTGSVRRTVIGTGTYTQDYDTMCDNPTVANLSWDAVTPMGTTLNFSVRTAATVAGLAGATGVLAATAPTDASPVDVGPRLGASMVTARRYVRVTVTFNPTTMPVASPVLRGMSLAWRCPYTVPAGG